MSSNGTSPSSSRATLLSVLFGCMVAAVIAAISLLFFGLFFLQALGILALLTAAGYLHYWLWGHALSRAVEQETPVETQPGAEEDWPLEPPRHHRRF